MSLKFYLMLLFQQLLVMQHGILSGIPLVGTVLNMARIPFRNCSNIFSRGIFLLQIMHGRMEWSIGYPFHKF